MVWEEMKRERNRLWVSNGPTPGWGRAESIAYLSELVCQNARALGQTRWGHSRIRGVRNPIPALLLRHSTLMAMMPMYV